MLLMDEPYFSEEIAEYLNNSHLVEKPEYLDLLTKSELKLIKHISENKTSQDIAEELIYFYTNSR